MLHRISIFDIATLEAMKAQCSLILSEVGGNIDFNKNDNVIFSKNAETCNMLFTNNVFLNEMKDRNLRVFHKYFSPINFYVANCELLEK